VAHRAQQFLSVGAAVTLAIALGSCGFGPSSASGHRPAASTAAHPPVVMIVFDEFSTTSLLDAHGAVDSVRYPRFAQLARESTWFPKATASLDETGRALRSLFTGSTTARYAQPTYEKNPRNLFTLMGKSYRLNASEEVTSMCPRRLCPGVRRQSQRSVLHELGTGRPERFDRWLRSVRAASRPTFYFKHVLLPHGPWRYLPSGREFTEGPTKRKFSFQVQHFNRWLVDQHYQQHLLQVGYTDRLLGRAIDRLKATGIWDRALVVVTADNGESFGRLGNGHEISRGNAADIALTPLFVKLPAQRRGRVEARHVRIIDLLPTIAAAAHLRPNWRVEGRSVFGPAARRIPASALLVQRSGHRIHLSAGTLRREAEASLRLKLRLFGSGDGKPGLFGIGPYAGLHGTPVGRLKQLPANGTRALVDSGFFPVKVSGRLAGKDARKRMSLAIAANGVIAATAPTIDAGRRLPLFFSTLLPESALRAGGNSISLYEISGSSARPRLRPLGG
jgi:hypothetical protein